MIISLSDCVSSFSHVGLSQQTEHTRIAFVQCRPNVFDVGPTLYKCYKCVLFTIFTATVHRVSVTSNVCCVVSTRKYTTIKYHSWDKMHGHWTGSLVSRWVLTIASVDIDQLSRNYSTPLGTRWSLWLSTGWEDNLVCSFHVCLRQLIQPRYLGIRTITINSTCDCREVPPEVLFTPATSAILQKFLRRQYRYEIFF